MSSSFKRMLLAVGLAAAVVAGWRGSPHWLPRLVENWLPPGATVTLDSAPGWRRGLYVDGIALRLPQCQAAQLSGARLLRQQGRWLLDVRQLTVDADCLRAWPQDTASSPMPLAQLQRWLSLADVTVHRLILTPWLSGANQLRLATRDGRQSLTVQGEQLRLLAEAAGDALTLREGQLSPMPTQPTLNLSGALRLGSSLDSPPVQGEVRGALTPLNLPAPVSATLRWQGNQGEVALAASDETEPLLTLPWRLEADRIQVSDGRWRWPYGAQPLTGGLSLTLEGWRQGNDDLRLTARLNMLTQGHNGRANAVLTLGPGRVGLNDSDLRFQLTGQANAASVSFAASLPGVLRGPLLTPTLSLQPGALLRAWGTPRPGLTLIDARWPLAGIKVDEQGVSGRLQAIVKAREAYWGRFQLHLDGQARQFWPDKGRWQWRYWGKGELPPLQGRWDLSGRGRWQESLIEVDTLTSGLDQLRYGLVQVQQPRLTLTEPLRWRRDDEAPSFAGALRLAAQQVRLSGAGALPPAELTLKLHGQRPADFQWQGALQAQRIGPVRLFGRWDGQRLRGGGWWPPQSLRVFQPLLPPDWKIVIRDGQFYGQTAFSAARGQGFKAGGHWVVKQGGAWLKTGAIDGVNFTLPYRFENHRWQLGIHSPVTLHIDALDDQFQMRNIRAQVFGAYPYSERYPLTLAQVDVDMLRGRVSLSPLRLPQRDAAWLRLEGIDMSELLTALKVKPLAISGKVSGVLPINLHHPSLLVAGGRLANDGPLTLRLDAQLAEELAQGGMADAAVVAWLRYLEISRSYATVTLNNQGDLLLESQIRGHSSSQAARREVVLNYRHQENIFQLWRSLRFGDNLQDALEQRSAR